MQKNPSNIVEEINTEEKQPLLADLNFNGSPILVHSDSDEDDWTPKNRTTKHSRTPSGTELTDIVEDIRTIFSGLNNNKRKREDHSGDKASKAQICKCDSQLQINQDNHPTVTESERHVTQESTQSKTINTCAASNRHNISGVKVISTSELQEPSRQQLHLIASIIKDKHQQSDLQDQEDSDHRLDRVMVLKGPNNMQDDQTTDTQPTGNTMVEEDMNMETNSEDNPQSLSLKMVQQMFKEIKDEMGTLQKAVQNLENKKTLPVQQSIIEGCTKKVLKKVNEELESDNQELIKAKKDVRHLKYQNKTLANALERLTVDFDDMKLRMDNLEMAGAKKAVTITGIEINRNKNEGMEQIEHFIYDSMGIEVGVDDFYKMGKDESKITIVYFQSQYDKRMVMKHKYLLKDYRSKVDKPVYINEYSTAVAQERKMKEVLLKTQNEQSATPAQVSYIKGKLAFQGETYSAKITVPTPKQLVDLTPEDLDNILKLPIESSQPLTKDKSIFEGYTASVNNIQQIRKLYIKMKLIQPTARHIVCAYKLPDQPAYNHNGYCDDGEPGAGDALLQLLSVNQLDNRVIFVARKYGGIRMGAERFQCYLHAAKSVIEEHPYNTVLKTKQQVTEKEEIKPYQPQRKSEQNRRYQQQQQRKQKTQPQAPHYPGQPQQPRHRKMPQPSRPWTNTDGAPPYSAIRGGRPHTRGTRQPYSKVYPTRPQSFKESNSWSYQTANDWEDEYDQSYYSNSHEHGNNRHADVE